MQAHTAEKIEDNILEILKIAHKLVKDSGFDINI